MSATSATVGILITIFLCLTIIYIVELTRKTKSLKRGVKVIDFSKYRDHKEIHEYHAHKHLRSGSIYHPTSTRDVKVVTEKNAMKTRHHLYSHKLLELITHEGGRYLIHDYGAISAVNEGEKARLLLKVAQLESSLGEANAELLDLQSQLDLRVDKGIEKLAKTHKAVSPIYVKAKSGGGSNYGR